jgi:hypothetical protein
MKAGATTSNLLYWPGGATPVTFGPPLTVDYSLSLFGMNDIRAAADGTDRLIAGGVIDATAADGFIHRHRFFFLDDDHDDGNATAAAAGVYLVALRLRMESLDRSAPFYLLWSTPGISLATLSAAVDWVDDRAEQLALDFSADFDGDLDVDGADFLTWQRNVGTGTGARQINGDANRDDAADAADLAIWTTEFGRSLATLPGVDPGRAALPVPEPCGCSLWGVGLFGIGVRLRLRSASPRMGSAETFIGNPIALHRRQ